jgi:hypothetical protein
MEMNKDKAKFTSAWAQLSAAREAKLKLEDTPAYPLARTVQMPADFSYPSGAVSFRLQDLQIEGALQVEDQGSELEPAADTVQLRWVLQRLQLHGTYSLHVKPDPILDLDTGGNLMDLPPEACLPATAGADPDDDGGDDGDDGDVDPQTEAWLNQARDQRTRLQSTENGQRLLALHNEHNETFDEVFRTSNTLPGQWKAGGATKQMAAVTSDAINADGTVNDSATVYANGLNYNANAFMQQLNVALTCIYTDPNFSEETGPDVNGKYWAAAKAALSFGKGVGSSTSNSKSTVQEMKPSEVHTIVSQHDGDLPEVTDDEMYSIMSDAAGQGGADSAIDLGWIVLDEEDRKRARFIYQSAMKQRAQDNKHIGQSIYEGACSATLEEVEATIRFARGADGSLGAPLNASVQLPAFEFELDDSQWTGDVGQIARERLENMYFIRSLLHDSIVDRLQEELLDMANQAYQTL